MMILIFSFFLLDFSNKDRKSRNYVWFWYALGASLLTSGYTLGSKYFINENIPLLTRMFYSFFAMGFISGIDLYINRIKLNVSKSNLFFLIGLGITTFLFNVFAQLAFAYAPNPGFVNAFVSISIIPVTFLSVYFFKDELKIQQVLGVTGILVGLVMLTLYS